MRRTSYVSTLLSAGLTLFAVSCEQSVPPRDLTPPEPAVSSTEQVAPPEEVAVREAPPDLSG